MAGKKRKEVKPQELHPAEQLDYFLQQSEAIARQAKRSKQSLKGNNRYAERFHDARTQATRAFREMQSAVTPIANAALERTISDTDKEMSYFFDSKTSDADRRDLRRHVEMLVKTEIEPALKSIRQQEAEYIPIEIVDGSRGYVVNVTRQINRCFQGECYDAGAVMIRRLLETLIIEVFEKKGLANNIKDQSGNYLMFADLVNRLINTVETPVGKTTRKELPIIAVVLNNCAHSRSFNISKAQLVQYQAFIVITIQELMILWDIRIHN